VYNSEQFIRYAKEHLGLEVNPESIQQIREEINQDDYPHVKICKAKDNSSLYVHNLSSLRDAVEIRLEAVDEYSSYILTSDLIEVLAAGESMPLNLRIQHMGSGCPPLSQHERGTIELEPHLSTEHKYFDNLARVRTEKSPGSWPFAVSLTISLVYTDASGRVKWKSTSLVTWDTMSGSFSDVEFQGITRL
jgi:hypothetical protein